MHRTPAVLITAGAVAILVGLVLPLGPGGFAGEAVYILRGYGEPSRISFWQSAKWMDVQFALLAAAAAAIAAAHLAGREARTAMAITAGAAAAPAALMLDLPGGDDIGGGVIALLFAGGALLTCGASLPGGDGLRLRGPGRAALVVAGLATPLTGFIPSYGSTLYESSSRTDIALVVASAIVIIVAAALPRAGRIALGALALLTSYALARGIEDLVVFAGFDDAIGTATWLDLLVVAPAGLGAIAVAIVTRARPAPAPA